MLLEFCKKIIIDTCYKLQPHCEKINIAGSVRRMKPNPDDLEIICIPQTVEIKDLFGNVTGTERTKQFIETVEQLGTIIKGRPATGRYVQIMLPEQIKLDLFIPQQHDYYRIYAIRTGSAEFANKKIAAAWLIKGWCGTDEGLRRQSDCVKQGDTWKCMVKNPTMPPIWKSEEEFFFWLGLSWVNPRFREIENFKLSSNFRK